MLTAFQNAGFSPFMLFENSLPLNRR